MSQVQSPKYIFIPPDYDSSAPNFVQNLDLPRNIRFASKKIPIRLDNTNHGVVTIDIQYEGDINYGCVAFTQSNGLATSVTTNPSKLFVPGNIDLVGAWSFIKDGNKTYQRFYVLVNVDPSNVSDILFINIGLGQFTDKIPTYSSVTVLYNCPEPVYKYTMGLHVYSSYDAITSPKLRTNLYSLTPLSEWGIGTLVYSSELFNNPALPYYYGYKDKVYKVGGSLNRAFGTTKYFRTVKKNAFAKVKTTTITDGPRSYYNSGNDTSPACVTPKMSDIGKIKEIILQTSLIQPLRYRYYLGYDDNFKFDSTKSTFTHYRYKTKEHLPITGSLHANIKLGSGFVNGYDSSSTDWGILFGQFGMSSLMTWNGLGNFAAVSFGLGLGILAVDAIVMNGFYWLVGCGCGGAALKGIFGLATVPGLGLIFLAVAVILILVVIFKRTVVVTREDCLSFLHRYTPTPYMEINALLTDKVYTNVPTGFYCDGIYYYQTTSGRINSKTPCTGLFYEYSEDENTPVKYTTQSSVIPDSPTLVTRWDKLIVLPYTSGKPEPICKGTIYYNQLIERAAPKNCCALEICTDTKITIEAGQEFSCVSQSDADNKALALLNSSYDYATIHGNYSDSILDENLGILDSKFTNISWLEYGTTSSLVSEFARLFFDNTDRSGLSVGKTVYFDPSGCQKVLKGYYTGAPYGGSSNENPSAILINQPVKTYQIENGKIKSINVEANTKSLYQSYISNWFLTDVSYSTLVKLKELMDNSRTFDPLTLETNINCYQGIIKKTSYTDYSSVEDFLIFSGGTYVQAPEGFYLPLIDWINYDPFYYSKFTEILLNISESCETPTNRGFYITGINNRTNSVTPVFNSVKLEAIVTSTNGKSKTYSVTTSATLEKTFIPYGTFFTSTDIIDTISISKILTNSPLNNISYLIGNSYTCPSTNAIVIPCGGSFTPTTNLQLGYYEITTNIGEVIGTTSIEFNAGDTPDRFQIYWDNKLVCDSLFVGNLLSGPNRQYYVDEIIKTKTLNRYVFNNSWKPYITPFINVSYSLNDIASNGPRLTESPQLGVDKYYGNNMSDGKIKLIFDKTKLLPSSIRIVTISPTGPVNWSIDKLSCPSNTATMTVSNAVAGSSSQYWVETYTIELPLVSNGTYNFVCDWGDGKIETITSYDQRYHTYTTRNGTKRWSYDITLTGQVDGFSYRRLSDNQKKLIESISSWGLIKFINDPTDGTSDGLFFNCINLTLDFCKDAPNLGTITSLDNCFENCNHLVYIGALEYWNVSNIRGMYKMFARTGRTPYQWQYKKTGGLNNIQDLSRWNTSNVTYMDQMYIESYLNHNVGNWDVRKVVYMERMFTGNFYFTNGDSDSIKNWYTPSLSDTSSATIWAVYGMFSGATRFNQPLTNFCFNNVTNTSYMFQNCYEFNQDCSNWERPGASMQTITRAVAMFSNCRKFNGSVNTWNLQRLDDMSYIFRKCYEFNKPLDNWNLTNLTWMIGSFTNCFSFNQNLGSWRLSKLQTAENRFMGLCPDSYTSRTTFALSSANLNSTLVGWSSYIFSNSQYNTKNIAFPNDANDGTCTGKAQMRDKGWRIKWVTTANAGNCVNCFDGADYCLTSSTC